MSKRKTATKTAETPGAIAVAGEITDVTPDVPDQETPDVPDPSVDTKFPLSRVPGGYVSTNMNVRIRPGDNYAATAKRLARGLNSRDDRLRNGRHVSTVADAIRWLLEHVEANGEIVCE